MKLEPQDDTLLRSYLLGELREEEADRLERRLLQEDELFDLAEAVEADLLAAVDGGDLAPAERERVLKRLASSPQGRERLAFARSLHAEADKGGVVVPIRPRVPAFRHPVIRWAALAASLLVLPSLVWFAWQYGPEAREAIARIMFPTPDEPILPELTPPVTPVSSPPSPPIGEEKKAAPTTVEPPRPRSVPLAVVAITLGGLRGADEKVAELRLSPDSHMAELQIEMEGRDAKSFAVVIHRDQEERSTWEESDLKLTKKSGGPMLLVHVPAEKFSTGLYEIAVTPKGEEMAESQFFQVVKKNR